MFALHLGFACRVTDETLVKVKCGTPGFADPEVLKGYQFTPKSDVFSLGSLLYSLITGKNLFPGRNPKDIIINN